MQECCYTFSPRKATIAGVHIVSLNLNGIRAAHRHGLNTFLQEHQVDIFLSQEVRATEAQLPALDLPAHRAWHPAEKKGYSGVGFASTTAADKLQVGMGIAEIDAQGRFIQAEIAGVTIISVYVPSGGRGGDKYLYKLAFLEAFFERIRQLIHEGRELIIAGDYNIAHHEVDLKNWRQNQKTVGFLPEERTWLSNFADLGLIDVFRHVYGSEKRQYSWWSQRSGARARDVGWRLDYQWVTPRIAERVHSVAMPREPYLSDHAPVIVHYGL